MALETRCPSDVEVIPHPGKGGGFLQDELVGAHAKRAPRVVEGVAERAGIFAKTGTGVLQVLDAKAKASGELFKCAKGVIVHVAQALFVPQVGIFGAVAPHNVFFAESTGQIIYKAQMIVRIYERKTIDHSDKGETVGRQDARNFTEQMFGFLYVFQHVPTGDNVEIGIRKWQRFACADQSG
jgi:hypothetical protein